MTRPVQGRGDLPAARHLHRCSRDTTRAGSDTVVSDGCSGGVWRMLWWCLCWLLLTPEAPAARQTPPEPPAEQLPERETPPYRTQPADTIRATTRHQRRLHQSEQPVYTPAEQTALVASCIACSCAGALVAASLHRSGRFSCPETRANRTFCSHSGDGKT